MKNLFLFVLLFIIAFVYRGEFNFGIPIVIHAAILFLDWIFINYFSTEIVQVYDKINFFKKEEYNMGFFWLGCVVPVIGIIWKFSEEEFINGLGFLSFTAVWFVMFKVLDNFK